MIGRARVMIVTTDDMLSGGSRIIAGVDERRRRAQGRERAVHCEGKQGFERPHEARKVAARMKGRATVYRCEFCHRFHIGSEVRAPRPVSRPGVGQRRPRQRADDPDE